MATLRAKNLIPSPATRIGYRVIASRSDASER